MRTIAVMLLGSASLTLAENLDEQIARLQTESSKRAAGPAASSADDRGGRTQILEQRSKAPAAPTKAAQAPPTPPAPPAAPAATPAEPAQTDVVWTLDPRDMGLTGTVAKEGYERTSLKVERVLIAASRPPNAPEDAKPDWTQNIPISVPVLYPSRTLRLDARQAERARVVLKNLESLQKRAAELKAESERTLKEWNSLIEASIPQAVLGADSPSLPANQSAGELNRGKPAEGFLPGKDIRVQTK